MHSYLNYHKDEILTPKKQIPTLTLNRHKCAIFYQKSNRKTESANITDRIHSYNRKLKRKKIQQFRNYEHLQEIGYGFDSGSLVDSNLIAPHYELLLIRQAVFVQAAEP